MQDKLAKMQEIANRGIQDQLPPDKRVIFEEAIKRGLIKTQQTQGQEPQMPTMASHKQPQAMPSHTTQPVSQEGFAADFFTEQGITPEISRGTVGQEARGLVDTGRVARNLPSDALQVGKDAVGLITDFPQVMEGVKALASGVYNTATTGEVDPVISQIKQAAIDKYGTMDKFIEAFEAEPLQTGMLIGGGLGLTGATMKAAGALSKAPAVARGGQALIKAGTAMDLPTQVVKGAAKVAALPARGMMDSATKLGTTIDIPTKNKFFDAMFKHNIMPNAEGVHKIEKLISGYNTQIDDLIRDAGTAGGTIRKNDVLAKVSDMLEDVWQSGSPTQNKKRILRIMDDYESNWPDDLTPTQAQRIKKQIYKEVHFDKKPGRVAKPQYTELGMKEAAKGLKEELEQMPGLENIKFLNADEGVLLELVEPLTRAMNRIEQQNIFTGVGKAIGAGAGASAGAKMDLMFGTGGVMTGTGAVLGFIAAQPKLQAKLALVLKRAEMAARKAQTGGAVGATEEILSDLSEVNQ